jgi:hypothetical protein
MDALALRNPRLPKNVILMSPGSEFQLKTNRDYAPGSKVTYSIAKTELDQGPMLSIFSQRRLFGTLSSSSCPAIAPALAPVIAPAVTLAIASAIALAVYLNTYKVRTMLYADSMVLALPANIRLKL